MKNIFVNRSNGVGTVYSTRRYVRTCVRREIYSKPTAGPRSDNFCTHMHIDKASSPIFIQIVDILDLPFQCQKFESITLECLELTLVYSVCHLGLWNYVQSNILAFLFKHINLFSRCRQVQPRDVEMVLEPVYRNT